MGSQEGRKTFILSREAAADSVRRAQSPRPLNSQTRAGVVIDRVAFPQLPWAILKDPQFLKTANGGTLLVDGWYSYCRKPHYMADILQALCWGLICGFEVLLPYWYVCFFVPMIIHRAVRDDARCAEKYGADWDTYIRRVPYVFVPGLV